MEQTKNKRENYLRTAEKKNNKEKKEGRKKRRKVGKE